MTETNVGREEIARIIDPDTFVLLEDSDYVESLRWSRGPDQGLARAHVACRTPEGVEMTMTENAQAVEQRDRAKALVERIGTIADLASSKPLEGDLGDIACDLLRQAAAQISSDAIRLATSDAAYRRGKLDGIEAAAELMHTRAAMHAETASEEEYQDCRRQSANWCQEAKAAAKAIAALASTREIEKLDEALIVEKE